MADDFYAEAGRSRLQDIAVERAEALASLERAKSMGDYATAGSAVQQIANLDAESNNLVGLYNRYIASQTPPPQRVPTLEERRARPISAMDWDDVVEMTRQSKYARDIRPDDPNMIAGWYEGQRRSARGE
jgi:hypothetical protein